MQKNIMHIMKIEAVLLDSENIKLEERLRKELEESFYQLKKELGEHTQFLKQLNENDTKK